MVSVKPSKIDSAADFIVPCAPDACVIYARVSPTDKQRTRTGKRGEKSVSEQVAELRLDAQENGWTVLEVFEDLAISASEFSNRVRPNFIRLEQFLRLHRPAVLMAWESSRLTRKLGVYDELWQLCKRLGIKWWYAGQLFDPHSAEDRHRTASDALDAERESAKISRRVRRAVQTRVRNGGPPPKTAFGYLREGDTWIPDPAKAPILVDVFERIARGESSLGVVRHLSEVVPDAFWSVYKVRRMIERPSYRGIVVHNGVEVGVGNWEPLVSPELYAAAMAALAGRPPAWTIPGPESATLLSSIAACAQCGGIVRGRRDGALYYVCGSMVRRPCRMRRPANLVDELVTAALTGWIESKEAVLALAPRAEKPAIRQTRDELLVWQERVELYADRLSQATGTAMRKFSGLLTDASAEVDRLQAVLDAELSLKVSWEILEFARAISPVEVWNRWGMPQRREAVRQLMAIKIDRKTPFSRELDPGDVTITWRHREG